MPTASPNSSSSSSSILSILSLFDPRKWVGILFSILGVLASVIVPFLPTRITKLLAPTNTVVVVPRRSHVRNASQASQTSSASPLARAAAHHYPHAVSSRASKLSNRRHTSLNLTSERPRPHTQRHSSFPSRVDSAPASSSSSTVKIDSDPNLSLIPRESPGLISNTAGASRKLPHIYSPNIGLRSRQSLDSLDLATCSTTPPSIPQYLPSRKVSFLVSNSTDLDLRPSPDYFPAYDSPASALLTNTTSTARGIPEIAHYESDWHGNDTFAVKRPVIVPSPAEALIGRRKPQRDDSGLAAQPVLTITPLQPEDVSPSVSILDPSPSSGNSLLYQSVDSNNNPTGAVPLEQLVMPPERPMRTDPYKKFNIPAPGSERAMAFLKAEKEWIKAETERRKREHRASTLTVKPVTNTPVEPEKLDTEDKKSSGSKSGHCRRHSLSARRKPSKDTEIVSSPPPPPELGSVASEDGENSERLKVFIPQTPTPDEFGVLPAPLSAVPEEDHATATDHPHEEEDLTRDSTSSSQQRLSQGKRLWVFSKRSKSQHEGAKEKWKEEATEKKPERLKSKDDSKIKVPRISLKGVKDGGYVSDTAVTSLTYQLM